MSQFRSAKLFYVVVVLALVVGGFIYVSLQASADHKREEAFREGVQQARFECLEQLRKAGHRPGTPAADPEDLKCQRINTPAAQVE